MAQAFNPSIFRGHCYGIGDHIQQSSLCRFILSKCIWMPGQAGAGTGFHLRLILHHHWDAWFLSYRARWSNSQWAGPVVRLKAPGYTKSWQPPGMKEENAMLNTWWLWPHPAFLIQQSQTQTLPHTTRGPSGKTQTDTTLNLKVLELFPMKHSHKKNELDGWHQNLRLHF